MAIDINEQIKRLNAAREPGFDLNALNTNDSSSLIDGARQILAGRAQGMSMDDTIVALARQLVEQDNQKVRRNPKLAAIRARELESFLGRGALGMDEADMKDEAQLIRDRELFGFGDIEEAEMAQGDYDSANRSRKLRENRVALRQIQQKRAKGERLTPKEISDAKYLQKQINKDVENQKYFDFGLQGREKIVVQDAERGRVEMNDPNPDLGVLTPVRTPSGELITPAMREAEARREKLRLFVEGMGAKAEEDRRFRGDLSEREMQEEARLAAGRQGSEVFIKDNKGGFEDFSEAMPPVGITRTQSRFAQPDINFESASFPYTRIEGVPRQGEGTVRIKNHAFNPVTPESAQAAVLDALRAKKERGRAGMIDKIRLQNITKAGELAAAGLSEGIPATVRGGNIINLGGVKDKSADMGLRIGNQRVSFDDAIPVRRPDGSIEWFDANKMELLGDQNFDSKPMQVATPASELNAPIQGDICRAPAGRSSS